MRIRDALFTIWPDTQQQLCRYYILANVALQSNKKFIYNDGEGEEDLVEDQRQADEA
jgi:hypothetical protein